MNGRKGKNRSAAIMGIVVLCAILLVLNVALANVRNVISMGLGSYFSTTVSENDDYTVESNYLTGYEACVDIMSEGTVLLKNEDNLLPLADGTRVTLTGAGSYNYVLGGTGSAGGKDDEYTISMYDAFAEAGLDINDSAWNKLEYACGGSRGAKSRYGSSEASYFVAGSDDANGWTSYKMIHEFSSDAYTDYILKDLNSKYTNIAIVTLSRSGAEGASPAMNYYGETAENTSGKGTQSYFQLSKEEDALLKLCKEKFDHTIVLINSSSQMELGFLDSDDYNIDAALWIGHPGEAGLVGVGYVLTGLENPSGALVDTYAYDHSTTPSWYNNDDNTYSNSDITDQSATKYYQYEEGIYVGYRYYETADAEGYFDSDQFKAIEFKNGKETDGYDSVVQFPFGYGLSYTTFTQQITSSDIKLDVHGTNSITVKVTNTGNVAGKEIVQLYMEAPYNQDSSLGIQGKGLEKSKVVLIGYAKTSELEPKASEEVTIEFQTDDITSYDNFGQGCYVLEKGDYYFNIQDNAHCWSQTSTDSNAVYGSVKVNLAQTYVYNDEGVGARDSDQVAAENCMDDVTAGDGNMLDGYLSRSDFASGMSTIMQHSSNCNKEEALDSSIVTCVNLTGTQSTTYTYSVYKNGVKTTASEPIYGYGNNAALWGDTVGNTGISVTDFMADKTTAWDQTYYIVVDSADEVVLTVDSDGDGINDDFNMYTNPSDVPSDELSQGSGVRLATVKDMGSVAAGDEKWTQLTAMISLSEAETIMGNCGWSTPAVESVGKEATTSQDGPGEPNNGGSDMVTWYPSATTIAATWNNDVAYEEGNSYGRWEVILNIAQAYAPAMNTHRSPYGGRNFEYYSEDGFISGNIGGSAVAGIKSTGTSVFIKHLALNDNDTNRGGVMTWANEQAVREIYMKTYEITCKDYGADGIMGSLNRIGMSWAHYGMYTTMLRDEWGWEGHLITDGDGSSSDAYNNPLFWIAGTQGSMLGSFSYSECISNMGSSASVCESDYAQWLLSQCSRHLLYQYGNSAMVAGVRATWWYAIWVIVDVLLVAGIALLVVFKLVLPVLKARKEGADAETDGGDADGTLNDASGADSAADAADKE